MVMCADDHIWYLSHDGIQVQEQVKQLKPC